MPTVGLLLEREAVLLEQQLERQQEQVVPDSRRPLYFPSSVRLADLEPGPEAAAASRPALEVELRLPGVAVFLPGSLRRQCFPDSGPVPDLEQVAVLAPCCCPYFH